MTHAVVSHAGQIAAVRDFSRGFSPSLACSVFAGTVPCTKINPDPCSATANIERGRCLGPEQRLLHYSTLSLSAHRAFPDVFPIDYVNACPDASVNTLHYYFPWAMQALVKWTVFAWLPDASYGREFCDAHPPDIGQQVLDWASGPAFDRLLIDTVTSTYPAHEHERFIAHIRGLVALWVRDEAGRLQG